MWAHTRPTVLPHSHGATEEEEVGRGEVVCRSCGLVRLLVAPLSYGELVEVVPPPFNWLGESRRTQRLGERGEGQEKEFCRCMSWLGRIM